MAKLTIKYKLDLCKEEQAEMEEELRAVLSDHGFEFYASGFEIGTGMRDIAFDDEVTQV